MKSIHAPETLLAEFDFTILAIYVVYIASDKSIKALQSRSGTNLKGPHMNQLTILWHIHFLPVPNPAWVALWALPVNGVAVVAILTGGANFLTVFAKKALGAKLITTRPVPASVAGYASSLCDFTRLLSFTVSTSVVRRTKHKPSVSHLSRLHKEIPGPLSRCGETV